MLPIFPRFKKLEVDDKKDVDEIIKKFPPYSDYNFVSLWSYNTEDDIILSKLNGNLVMRFRDYITNEPFYTFIGDNQINDTIERIQELAIREGLSPVLKLIPEHNIMNQIHLLEEKYSIVEDIDNFDYIVPIEEIKLLKGARYNRKLRSVHKFMREHPDYSIVELDLKNPHVKAQLIDVFNVWAKNRHKLVEDTKHELIAINRLLENSHHFILFGIGIMKNNRLIAFSISELTHNKHIIGHFMKADT
jgi:hypothetical protein